MSTSLEHPMDMHLPLARTGRYPQALDANHRVDAQEMMN